MKAYESILKGASLSLIGLVLTKLLSYFNTVIIARIGSKELGLLSLALSIISFIAMISLLGLNNGIIRYVAYYSGKKDKKNIKGVMLSGIKISSIVSIIMSTLVFIFAKEISINIFNKPELILLLRIFAFMIPLLTVTEIFASIFISFKKIQYNVLIRDFLDKFLRLIFILIIVFLGLSLNWIAFSYLVAALITVILMFNLIRKKEFQLFNKIKIKYNSREILLYSLPLIIASLLTLLQKWTDTFILGIYRTANEVGIYNIAFSTASLLAIIPTALMSLFMPVISNLYAQNKIKYLKEINNTVLKLILIINIPLAFCLIIFGKELINIVFSREYALGYVALVISAFAYLIISITHIYANNLLLFKKTKTVSLLVLISTLTNIIFSLILIPNYGINGAAFATFLSNLIFLFLIIIISKKLINLQLLKLTFIKIGLAGILSSLIIIYTKQFITLSFFIIILISILMLSIYLMLLFVLKCFNKNDLNLFRSFKNKINKRLEIELFSNNGK